MLQDCMDRHSILQVQRWQFLPKQTPYLANGVLVFSYLVFLLILRSLNPFFGSYRNLGYRADSERPSQGAIVAVQSASGLCAGAVGALVTTPMDTVKTRLQVS
jgi:hypothetical protein